MATYANPLDTLGDGLNEGALRLCQALGLDPGETTDVRLEVEPGIGAVARWSGVRKVDLERIARALEPPETARDPWAERET